MTIISTICCFLSGDFSINVSPLRQSRFKDENKHTHFWLLILWPHFYMLFYVLLK